MNRFMRRVVVSLALLVGISMGPALRPARAADLTPQQKQEMKSLYERATRAYDVGKYGEAIEEYQKAYEIGGDPPMLYNIAQAYRLNDQPSEAARFYRRYLQRAPNARNREDVERKIAEQEKIAEERRQAQLATQPPAPVTPTVPTPSPVTRSTPSPVTPPPIPAVTTPPPMPGPSLEGTPPPPASEEPRTSKVPMIVGLALIGAGAACGVAAIVEGKNAKDDGNELTTMSMSKTSVEFNPKIEQSGKNANTTTIVLGIAGGALAVAGAVVLIVGLSGGGATSEAAPPATARAMVAPWLGAGIVGAGADIQF